MAFPREYTLDEQNLVRSKLEPDEVLMWTAKPQPRLFADGRWAILLLGLIISGEFLFMLGMVFLFAQEISVFFLLIAGLQLCMAASILAIPIKMRASDRKKIYVLTNRRALVVHPSRRSLEAEWSGDGLQVLEVKLRGKKGGRGDLVLWREIVQTGASRRTLAKGFFDVENPLEVEELVKLCAEQGRAFSGQEVSMKILRYADRFVPAPTGEDEVNAMPCLSHGERLLWVGRPHVRSWRSEMVAVGFVGLIVLLLFYFANDFVSLSLQKPVVMSNIVFLGLIYVFTMGFPFVLASLWLRNRTGKTLYILTDKNAIVLKPHWSMGKMIRVHTWDLASCPVRKIAEGAHCGGYDIIWSYHAKIKVNEKPLAEGFLDMPRLDEPLAVLAKIQSAMLS